ncbi:MAG: galactokinase [Bacteroidetes bacterium]|nr:galactokinase [Bacteroidota bacterium]
MTTQNLIEKFESYFGTGSEPQLFFAPGRVNLIGEHIDYNGGNVLPCAIKLGITAVIRKNDSSTILMKSLYTKGMVKVDLNEEINPINGDWGNYPKGVIAFLLQNGIELSGCSILFYSTLPAGSGLSSSASLEVLTAYSLLKINNQKINPIEIALLCQKVENEYIGVSCGIMDQFSVAMGKKDCAILLNCQSLKYEYVPLQLNEYSLVIMNSNKKRELASSKYNERKLECDTVLNDLQNHYSIANLCEAQLYQLDFHIIDETLKRRARHVISENNRVNSAIDALQNNDIKQFGELLTASHLSLKNDYEVSGFELDTIVEESLKINGCIGARMTGAGFGGCAIALVATDVVDIFKEKVSATYYAKTNILPAFYESSIGAGVHELHSYQILKQVQDDISKPYSS